jgi:glycine/D-amino acid oxidase-like deaminating enzyme
MTAAKGATITVLGGGLMGLALAHQLARRGEAVLVLSRRRSEAAGFVAATFFAVAIGFSGCLEGDVWGLNAWVDGPSMALARMVMPLKAAGKGPELPR